MNKWTYTLTHTNQTHTHTHTYAVVEVDCVLDLRDLEQLLDGQRVAQFNRHVERRFASLQKKASENVDS
jgi:hypothetical protein